MELSTTCVNREADRRRPASPPPWQHPLADPLRSRVHVRGVGAQRLAGGRAGDRGRAAAGRRLTTFGCRRCWWRRCAAPRSRRGPGRAARPRGRPRPAGSPRTPRPGSRGAACPRRRTRPLRCAAPGRGRGSGSPGAPGGIRSSWRSRIRPIQPVPPVTTTVAPSRRAARSCRGSRMPRVRTPSKRRYSASDWGSSSSSSLGSTRNRETCSAATSARGGTRSSARPADHCRVLTTRVLPNGGHAGGSCQATGAPHDRYTRPAPKNDEASTGSSRITRRIRENSGCGIGTPGTHGSISTRRPVKSSEVGRGNIHVRGPRQTACPAQTIQFGRPRRIPDSRPRQGPRRIPRKRGTTRADCCPSPRTHRGEVLLRQARQQVARALLDAELLSPRL